MGIITIIFNSNLFLYYLLRSGIYTSMSKIRYKLIGKESKVCGVAYVSTKYSQKTVI